MEKERIATARKGPRNDKTIKVIEYVHTADGELVRVDQLGPEQYEKFRRWLGCTYLNELYRGRAEFYYPETAGDGLRFCGETTGAHCAPLRPETAGGHNG